MKENEYGWMRYVVWMSEYEWVRLLIKLDEWESESVKFGWMMEWSLVVEGMCDNVNGDGWMREWKWI